VKITARVARWGACTIVLAPEVRTMIQLLLALPLLAPAAPAAGPVQPPDKALLASVQAIRANDLHGYLKLVLTDAQLAEAQSAWDAYRAKQPTQDFRDKFSQVVSMLTASDAEDHVMALLEPKLVEARPQMAMASAMVTGLGQMAIQQNQKLSAKERDQATQVLTAVGAWLQNNDLTDTDRARKAVHVLCDMVRGSGIATLDDFYGMGFDDAMKHAGQLLGGVKGVLQVYGIPVDTVLDSVQARTVKLDDDHATLRVSFEIFGIKSDDEIGMILDGDRWVPEAAADANPAALAALPSKD